MADKKTTGAVLSEKAFDGLYDLSMLSVPPEKEKYLREKGEFEKALSLIQLLDDEPDMLMTEASGICHARDDEPVPSLSRESLTCSPCRTDGRFIIVKGVIDKSEGGTAGETE